MKIVELFKSLFKTPKHGLPDMEVSTPMPEVKRSKGRISFGEDKVWQDLRKEGNNISEPVYTIVQKIKDDPSRIEFTKRGDLTSTYFYFEDKLTNLKGKYSITYLLFTGDVRKELEFNSFSLTKEEEDFIVKELKPVLKEYNNERKQKLDNIRRQRLLRQWEK